VRKKLKSSAFLPAACLCIAWPLAQAQNAETGDTLQFRVGAGLERDSNVLRAPTGESDTIGLLNVGARIDKQYSLQRIVLDAELASYRYNDFSSLNYNTVNYEGAWHYAFTPRFRGVLSADQREYRDTTDATNGVTRTFVRTERTQVAEGTYAPGGGLLLQGGVVHRTSQSEAISSLDASPTITSVRVGVGYEQRSGSQAVLQYRRGDGRYDRLGIDFKENELAVVGQWALTGKTTLNGRLGFLERKHDNNPARDFDGWVGNLGVNWAATGKTSVDAGFARDLGSYENTGGGSVRIWRAYLQPVWRATAKTSVRLRYQHEKRDWSTLSGLAPDAGRSDSGNALGVYVDWEPRRNLHVTGSVRQERRDSSLNAFDYRATIVGLGARFMF